MVKHGIDTSIDTRVLIETVLMSTDFEASKELTLEINDGPESWAVRVFFPGALSETYTVQMSGKMEGGDSWYFDPVDLKAGSPLDRYTSQPELTSMSILGYAVHALRNREQITDKVSCSVSAPNTVYRPEHAGKQGDHLGWAMLLGLVAFTTYAAWRLLAG